MAAETSFSRTSNAAAMIPWRGLLAAAVALAVGWGGMAYAANNSVQGAPKKEDGGFDVAIGRREVGFGGVRPLLGLARPANDVSNAGCRDPAVGQRADCDAEVHVAGIGDLAA